MRRVLIALAVSALAACGGGGGNNGETKMSFSSVTTFGASLTDSGTFGYKMTVQPTEGETYYIWPERVAGAYGVDDLCPFYTSSDGSTFTPHTDCTNFAIAGSNINNYSASSGTANNTSPISILAQLGTAAQTASFDNSLVLVGGDSGANDVANMLQDVLTAVLTYQQSHNPAAFNGFIGRVKSLKASLPADSQAAYDAAVNDAIAALQAAAATEDTADDIAALAQIGGIYEKTLADVLAGAIKQTVLAAGAKHVVVQNTLDVTKTPKFQIGIPDKIEGTLIAAGYPEAQAKAVAAQMLAALIQIANAWLPVYNNELAAQFADDKRVVVVDFYTHFNNEMADPAQYGLTNVTVPGCTAVQKAMGASDAEADRLDTCTDTKLDAGLPGWRSYVFANSFHPTPYGHQLLAEMVTDALAKAGWL